MAQDISPIQILCSGSDSDGTAGATVSQSGCQITRNAAGDYSIAFDTVPPGPDVPAATDTRIIVNPLGVDPAVTNFKLTKTLDGAGPSIKGFRITATGSADTGFDFVVYRVPQG